MPSAQTDIICLTPLYNDWDNLYKLIQDMENMSKQRNCRIKHLIVIDDGSCDNLNTNNIAASFPITILHLYNNEGHQRAIAIGLSYIKDQMDTASHIVVLDSDGEDKPASIPLLVAEAVQLNDEKIIFALRKKRIAPGWFKLMYKFYQLIFLVLTGKKIRFGNFSCIPNKLIPRLTALPALWGHYAGSILKSGIPYHMLSIERGKRYNGKSKMNFSGLILHAFNSLAVYIDFVSARILMVASIGMVISLFTAFVILGIKIFTSLAIPGWASNMLLLLGNLTVLFFIITLLILLIQLRNHNPLKPPPSFLYKAFIRSIDCI